MTIKMLIYWIFISYFGVMWGLALLSKILKPSINRYIAVILLLMLAPFLFLVEFLDKIFGSDC